jgi:hypothetical protein
MNRPSRKVLASSDATATDFPELTFSRTVEEPAGSVVVTDSASVDALH